MARLASQSPMAATSRTMASPHSDQATRAAVRAVTSPLGCRGQRTAPPAPLIAQAGPSDGTFTYSAAVVRLGVLKVILPGDRPGIVTDFAARHVLAGFAIQPRKCQISSATDH